MSQLDRIEQKLDQLLATIGTAPGRLAPQPQPPVPGVHWRTLHANCTECRGLGHIEHDTGITICEAGQ